MGFWSWFVNGVGDFLDLLPANVNNGLIANPFLVKQTPDASHYHAGGQFGEVEGTVQRTSTELWAASDSGLVHVGLANPTENQPSYTLAAITNGLLRLVPEGKKFTVPRTDRIAAGAVEVDGPAYILENLDTAIDSFRAKLNADVWIEGGLAPRNRPVPAVIVYENVDISDDLDELVKTWYEREKKDPFWTDTRIGELVASWKLGESTVYIDAGYPIGLPATAPTGVVRPTGVPATSRYIKITVYDEFGVPIDLGWLLRHADLHADNELFNILVAPNIEIFRKDPVRGKLKRRDIIDIRDEHGLPYANRSFRRFDEADFPPLASVFDKDQAELVLATEPDVTGARGIWLGPEVTAAAQVVIQGVGLKDHLLAFLPTCASSTVVIKLRGYPGDYHRLIALPLHKWFPEQPNARVDQKLERFHLGCRVTPLIDGQSMLAAAVDALRATYERGESDPPSPIHLRPAEGLADARIWLCNWQIEPDTYAYGGNPELYAALNPRDHPELGQGLTAYPRDSLGFYLQSAIAAGVDVRVMPWFNIFGSGERGQNIEMVRSVNRFYDLNGYHTPDGPGLEAARAPHTAPGANLSRGFAFLDDKTRSQGAHHQKVSYIRNRYGNFAFVGGIDFVPRRWDTNTHLSPEERKPGRRDEATDEIVTTGWHDVHAMLEGPVVLDIAKNFFQRWNAYVADPTPNPTPDYPVDLAGVTAIANLPHIPEEGVPSWPGPASDLALDASITPHTVLDRGPEGRMPRRATQVCAIVRTIPPFIDAYDSFVKARPVPANEEPLGELGCRTSYQQAILNARNYIYLEDQYFVEPQLINLLISRLIDSDKKRRLRRLFVVVPHILADEPVVDAIYHHKRREALLKIQQQLRIMIGAEKGIDPEAVPQIDVDKIFTIVHLEHTSGRELYLHAKHMIVDDVWMVISSSNVSRRGMSYETEIGVTISDAEVEDGVRKVVRDHRIRLWAEHLLLDRSHWHRLLDPLAGLELMRAAVDNPNVHLIPFEINNPHIEFSYPADQHTDEHEKVYKFIADPDGSEETDIVSLEAARDILELLRSQ